MSYSTDPAKLNQLPSYRFVSDAEVAAWNAKQAALGYTPVPDTRKVNGKALSSDISLSSSDIGADPAGAAAAITLAGLGGVPAIRKINNHDLSADRTLAASAYFQPVNPTALTSSSYKMFGLGGTIKITPLLTGVIRFAIDFYSGGVGSTSQNSFKCCYGTGTAPANGAAASGTVIGPTRQGGSVASVSATQPTLSWEIIITGLTVGTAYWFDVQAAIGSGNTSVMAATIEAILEELPN